MSATDTSAPLDLDAIDAFRIVTDDDGRVVTMSREEWGRVASDVTQATHKQCTLRHVAVEAALEWDIVEIVPPGKPSRDAIVAEVRRLRAAVARRDGAAKTREAAAAPLDLDLDAIQARILAAPSCDCGRPSTQWCADSECGAESCDGHARQTGALGHEHRWTRYPIATEDAAALLAEASHLRAVRDAAAQAYDDIVALAWHAATGDDHEGPASVDDLIATLRQIRAAARREGAEAMREACAEEADARAADIIGMVDDDAPRTASRIAAAIRALPLPEVTP